MEHDIRSGCNDIRHVSQYFRLRQGILNIVTQITRFVNVCASNNTDDV